MYQGNSKCSGCGRSGTEAPRVSKKHLCPDCSQYLLIGISVADRYNLRVIVAEGGKTYCRGQLCELWKDEASRCIPCPMERFSLNEIKDCDGANKEV